MRREYCLLKAYSHSEVGSPLHAQGIPAAIKNSYSLPRITPACAGNTLKDPDYVVNDRDHPCMRREYTKKTTKIKESLVPTPHNLFSSK